MHSLLRVKHAGFVSQTLVASKNAIVNAYAFYIRGRNAGVAKSKLDEMIATLGLRVVAYGTLLACAACTIATLRRRKASGRRCCGGRNREDRRLAARTRWRHASTSAAGLCRSSRRSVGNVAPATRNRVVRPGRL